MKKRSMILALASMLGISAAATAVSGFAWFTTTTTATFQAHNYTVSAAQGSLEIGAVTDNDINCTTGKSSTSNEIEIAPTANTALADVSSIDGENFYKLYNIDTTNNKADILREADGTTNAADKIWMSAVNAQQMVCVSWSMTVKNGGDETTKMDVYLSANETTLFKGTGTASDNYTSAYRLAIFDTTDDKLVYFFSTSTHGVRGDDDVNGTQYVYEADVTEPSKTGYKWDGKGFTDADHKHASEAKRVSSASDVAQATDTATDAGCQLLINDLAGGNDTKPATPHTLKFVVWCEGTDTPEAQVLTANQVQLNIGLIGLNA